ncbi:class I SAM-dependent methyltransferase [Paucibacter sp. APW11]|uniref:Class I SAM-dependent methyltransferase n=1 Tax=Roseateles aquae TaxID=3077235 RepID=A0ABU3P6L6_9BURK|nr:class I SAM-dependent methyltransferase [Paucibacter sp. APW11]MDT8997718.1 class I SAM-dependent methyltransferase [Paucibacter sp. APW11]
MTAASARFDAIADNYAKSEVHETSPSLSMLRKLGEGRDDLDVCDVACGAGHSAFALLGHAKAMYGVDPSPNMLKNFVALGQARNAPVHPVEAFAEAIPLPDQSMDLVVCRLAAHHFTDIGRALAEFRRIVRKGGSVVIIDLHGDDDADCDGLNHQLEVLHDPTHIRSYTVSRWRELLEAAGLQIVELQRDLTERPGGVPLQRWCEIASSGDAAHAAMVALLVNTPAPMLESIGIGRRDGGYTVPVRTCFIHAQAS